MGRRPADALEVVCPACQRIRDHFRPASCMSAVPILRAAATGLLALIRHHEEKAKAAHPLARIIAIESADDGRSDHDDRYSSRPRSRRRPCTPAAATLSFSTTKIKAVAGALAAPIATRRRAGAAVAFGNRQGQLSRQWQGLTRPGVQSR